MSDDTIEVESCWTGEAGARKCLDQALHLVGLNDGPLGDQGVEIMVGEKQKIAKEHKLATKSCSTDHTAIFKRLADENVEIVGHGI
ncbi:hypothetical protein Ctob_015447 [Chrysochromulina tobinii]|uniref:Uncharacterized protein n=1 Tax=Chrysochromulina tobinii TaxID=1460289 RepID=A0A0M0K9L9_9EUKA|nr:hypothetical protein Ctob_015447 [Chrysochromulina tobinii]|eukprot:KOO35108.1 hypothetical protein Ctob_015447 [Chrysochromulina sp. CCMP291]